MTARKGRRTSRGTRRILAYLDPNARNRTLLQLAERLARHDGAEVLALSVVRDLPWYVKVDGRRSKQIRDALESSAHQALADDAASLERAGVKVRKLVRSGRPFEVIIREVLRRPTQLVLKTAHPDARNEAQLFGSTAMHLFRKCPAPVLTVKPKRSSRIRRVLAAVDPSRPTSGDTDVNVDILRWAQRLAAGEEADLHICHAFWVEGEHLLRNRISKDDYRQYLQRVAATVADGMEALLGEVGLSLDDPRVHLVKGDPGQLIPALIEKERIDLLVMGTVARSGVPGLLIGNTAERMLRSVDCSVLALKPEGFVSPVLSAG